MKSGPKRCLEAIDDGRHTVPEIAVHAHMSEADARQYLGRLIKRKQIEKSLPRYTRKGTHETP